MDAVPQKIKILKFVGEQGIVTVSDVARHLSKPEKFALLPKSELNLQFEVTIAEKTGQTSRNIDWDDNPREVTS